VRRRGSHIFPDIRLTDGGEIGSLTCRLPLPSGIFLVLISLGGWVDIWDTVDLEGSGKSKKKIRNMTIWGLGPTMSRLVAYSLNQPYYRVRFYFLVFHLTVKQLNLDFFPGCIVFLRSIVQFVVPHQIIFYIGLCVYRFLVSIVVLHHF
jgi:hypothetical protein